MATMIQPFIWLPAESVEEAARFYAGLFPDTESKVDIITRPAKSNHILTASVRILNQEFIILGDCPKGLAPTDAVSFGIACKTQQEIDRLWDGFLSTGGQEKACGWLTDKYGVSWQVYPEDIGKWMANPEKTEEVMTVMEGMKKLNLEALKKAHDE